MLDLFFTDHAKWFALPALVGTGFFLIRLVLMFVGGIADLDVHASVDAADAHHSTEVFKILSIQSVLAFMMGFGWAGLGAYRGMNLEIGPSLGVGVLGGCIMVYVLLWLLKLIYNLQSSGNISIESTIGTEGQVYVTVPGMNAGRGSVRVIVQNAQRIYNAVTDGPELKSNTRVRVVRANQDNTITVERA